MNVMDARRRASSRRRCDRYGMVRIPDRKLVRIPQETVHVLHELVIAGI
jgi:hypothetical protein